MTRLTATDFHPEVLKLFDQYVHGGISRRGFLDGASRHVAAGASAAGLLAALSPSFAAAQQVSPQDTRIKTSRIEIVSPLGYGTVKAYLAQPAQSSGKLGTVLVIHENRGLNPHIEDITRRLALDGFIALAPDALAPLGGYPGDEDKARELFPKLDQTKTREDFIAAFGYLKALPAGNGKVGAVGFCYGGGLVNHLATRLPELAAGVPFYGGQPAAADVPRIKAPLLLQYAGADERVNAGWPAYEAALKAAGVSHEAFIYPGVQHGFNNDTTPRYDEAAAKLSWQRTVAFFKRHLAA
ncbi:MAG: dienelactone hydrolase family protein [Rhizobacter sp.]|nr:dienelactone hydrolase family protein [Rhizobacter sp.]